MEKMFKIAELVEHLGICQAKIYKMMAAREFPAGIKIGVARRWPESDIAAWIERARSDAAN